MAQLKKFKDLKEKAKFFSNTKYYTIDSKKQFDDWFDFYTSEIKAAKKTDFIYRGMGDASYKLYTSAQRMWIENDMHEWANGTYLEFINDLVQEAKKYPLIQKVFDIYRYSNGQREFPILSIIQHYWGVTPLMDWTYNINVALFFAIDKISSGSGTGKLENYFSIYRINKAENRDEFMNVRQFAPFDNGFTIQSFRHFGDDNSLSKNNNAIFYISDFDESNSNSTTPNSLIGLITQQPITSIYNQNIIPQEGLFIFNAYSTKTIEEAFNVDKTSEGWNLELKPFACFNIKKDLADYIRRRIKQKFSIDHSFIYPHLYDDIKTITNTVLNSYSGK